MENNEEIEIARKGMRSISQQYYKDAQERLERGIRAQSALAEKLLLSAGASLGVLSTLFATNVSHIQPSDFLGPVVVFIISMIAAGFGLWARAIAFFKSSSHLLSIAKSYDYQISIAEKEHLGVPIPDHNSHPPQMVKFPELWFNLLDYALGVSGVTFIIGVSWTALNLSI